MRLGCATHGASCTSAWMLIQGRSWLRHSAPATSSTPRRSDLCSTRSPPRSPRSRRMVPTTNTASTPQLQPAIRRRSWSCRYAPMRCRATRRTRRRASAIITCAPSQSMAGDIWLSLARVGRSRHQPLQTGDRRQAALAHRSAPRDRGGHRRRRSEPHARTWTPHLRPRCMRKGDGRPSWQCPATHATKSCGGGARRRGVAARRRHATRHHGLRGRHWGGHLLRHRGVGRAASSPRTAILVPPAGSVANMRMAAVG